MRAVIHRRAHHAKDQVGLLFTSPHPNSGLPEFGTIGGPSRICPTWAGEVTLTESPRELFNVFVRTRLSGLTIHGRSREDLRLIRDCGPTLIASGGCSVPPPTGNGAPGRSSPPAGAPSSLRDIRDVRACTRPLCCLRRSSRSRPELRSFSPAATACRRRTMEARRSACAAGTGDAPTGASARVQIRRKARAARKAEQASGAHRVPSWICHMRLRATSHMHRMRACIACAMAGQGLRRRAIKQQGSPTPHNSGLEPPLAPAHAGAGALFLKLPSRSAHRACRSREAHVNAGRRLAAAPHAQQATLRVCKVARRSL